MFITTPQSTSVTMDEAKEQYLKPRKVSKFVISREPHQEQDKYHYHAWLQFEKKWDLTNPRVFDLTDAEGTTYLSNVKKADDLGAAYILDPEKNGTVITNLTEDEQAEIMSKWIDGKHKSKGFAGVIDTAATGSLKDAWSQLQAVAPRDCVMQGKSKLLGNLRGFQQKIEDNPCTELVFKDQDWWDFWQPNKHTLLLIGGAGLGKTSYIRNKFPKCLVINRFDRLKEFDAEKHDCIVFDDMTLTTPPFSRDNIVSLLGVETDSDVNIKYGCARIPAGTPRVVTNNVFPVTLDEHGAIARRIFCVRIMERMYEIEEHEQGNVEHVGDDLDKLLADVGLSPKRFKDMPGLNQVEQKDPEVPEEPEDMSSEWLDKQVWE